MSEPTAVDPQRSATQQGSLVELVVGSCAGLSLLALVCGAVYSVNTGHVNPGELGSVEGLEALKKGSGFLGFGMIIYAIIREVLNRARNKDETRSKAPRAFRMIAAVVPIAVSLASSYLSSGVQDQLKQKQQLERQVAALGKTRSHLLTFFRQLGSVEKFAIVDTAVRTVDLDSASTAIERLPEGKRKDAVYGAILLAWKALPFRMDGKWLGQGTNSPEFFVRLLTDVGVTVEVRPGELQSDAIIRACEKVTEAQPGDLMVYRGTERGATGRFTVMYLGRGREGGHGLGLGVLGAKYPLQILDSDWLDHVPPVDNFIGYYRPHYQ
jgi:hypothetical protein